MTLSPNIALKIALETNAKITSIDHQQKQKLLILNNEMHANF